LACEGEDGVAEPQFWRLQPAFALTFRIASDVTRRSNMIDNWITMTIGDRTVLSRRGFVRTATLATAASAFPGSLLGCGPNEIEPIGPCAAESGLSQSGPSSIPNTTYIRASEIGCALDCDLSTGLNISTGGAATDDGPTINAAMASASASNPLTLIIDGGALISGLFLPAGGYWGIQGEGCGSGFFVKAGTNNDGIHNGGPTANVPVDFGPGDPLPARGSTVSLSNFMLNGNQGNGLNGDSNTGMPQGTKSTWYFGINLMNLNNITLENLVVVNTPAYHFRLSNVGNVVASGCVMRSSGGNTDGLHFDGPANDISISNCSFTTGDDAIALNCPEGHSGNISRVSVTNCTFDSGSCLMRLYTTTPGGPEAQIDSVTVSNCTGTLWAAGFLIGLYAYKNPNAVLALSVSNCQLTTPAILDISTDFSAIELSNVTLTPSPGSADSRYALARTSSSSAGAPFAGSSLTLASCAIQRTGNYPVSAVILNFGSTIGTVEVNGFAVQDPAGSSYAVSPELLDIEAGSIGQLVLDAATGTHIASAVSSGGFSEIGTVSGTGVLATGWEFPDSVMVNQTPYISATNGQGSIKVGGVVKPYP
jgi:hypothetical protein